MHINICTRFDENNITAEGEYMLCYELLHAFISPLFQREKRVDLLVVYFIINDKYFEMSGSNNRQIYKCWMTVQDIICRASLWPVSITGYFWT